MKTYEIRKNVFAIGAQGKRATNVVKKVGKKFVGVRGQRPVIDERFKPLKPSAALAAALKGA